MFLCPGFSPLSFVFLHGFVPLSVGGCRSLHLFCDFLSFGRPGLLVAFVLPVLCYSSVFLPGFFAVSFLSSGVFPSGYLSPHPCVSPRMVPSGFVLTILVAVLSVVLFFFSLVRPHRIACFNLGPFLHFLVPGSSLLVPLLLSSYFSYFFPPSLSLCLSSFSCPISFSALALNDLHGPSAGPLARIPYFIHSFSVRFQFLFSCSSFSDFLFYLPFVSSCFRFGVLVFFLFFWGAQCSHFAASVAFARLASLSSFLGAATWGSSSVFTSFSLRDVQFSSSRVSVWVLLWLCILCFSC